MVRPPVYGLVAAVDLPCKGSAPQGIKFESDTATSTHLHTPYE